MAECTSRSADYGCNSVLIIKRHSQSYGNVHEAVAEPLYDQRLVYVGNGLVADILSRALIDLHVRLLDDVQQNSDATAGSHATARQPHRLKIDDFPYSRPQQAAA